MNYFRTDFMPEPISSLALTHPRRPSPLARLARWTTRPLLEHLYKQAIADVELTIATYVHREGLYLRACHDTAARQMRTLADVERAYLARLWFELDALRGNG